MNVQHAIPVTPSTGDPFVPMPRREGDCTFEDYLWMIPEGQKADLLDGVIYMAPPDNTDANDLNGWLDRFVGGYVETAKLGRVFVSRVSFRLGPKRGPEPDLAFLAKDQLHRVRRNHVDGPPTFVIEIVSPDSVDRDYIEKRAAYEQAGVPEYWILDPDAGRTTFLCLKDGRYEEFGPVDGVIECRVLPGLRLEVKWLLNADRPSAIEMLRKLLP